jgi:hypothetical protein
MGSDINVRNSSANKPLTGYYTGYNINNTPGSRTVQNADLVRGAVLQLNPNPEQDGYNEAESYSVPTAGVNTLCAVVDPDVGQHELREVNRIDPAIANKRVGGAVPIRRSGIFQVLVKDGVSCTKGQTMLVPEAGGFALIAQTVPGGTQREGVMVGAPGRPFAVALETVALVGGNALVKCLVFGDGHP